jgi:hypothetical protein
MSVQGLINEVKAVLRTEGLPLTDAEIARMVGRVAQTLSTLVPLLPVRHQISTTRAGEYLLPDNIILIERVVYKPSASATVSARNTNNNRLTVAQNLRERGWASSGVLLNRNNRVRQRYSIVSDTILAVEDARQFAVGDIIEEDTEAIELPLQAITAPNRTVRGVAGDTDRYAVGLFGQWLRLSPDEKAGRDNLTIYAYASHPPVSAPNDEINLPPYTASYLIYETAHRVLLQFAGEEAPPLLQALRNRAEQELQILMMKSATVQNPPTITFYRRRRSD